MDIWEDNKLPLFIAFVIPGFISLKVYEAFSLQPQRDSSQQLINAIAYSCVNYGLLLFPILRVEESSLQVSRPTLYSLFWMMVVLVAPILWPSVMWLLRKHSFMQRLLPHPIGKPWDYVFKKRQRYWAIITLKDGRRIGGRYDSKSFVSSAPHAEQVFLEEAWVLNADGGFERPRDGTAGIIVLGSEIVTVEFFAITDEGQHVGQGQNNKQTCYVPRPEGLPTCDTSEREADRRLSAREG